jgi:hypothetical protein
MLLCYIQYSTLQKGLRHPWILLPAGGPGANPHGHHGTTEPQRSSRQIQAVKLSLAEGHPTICMGQSGRDLEFYKSESTHDSSRALVLNSPTEDAKVPENEWQLTLISG